MGAQIPGTQEWATDLEWATPLEAQAARVFYRHVDRADLHGRPDSARTGAVRHTLAIAQDRPAEHPIVAVSTPDEDRDGWTCGRTVVTVVTEDMPFLVDSVYAELSRLGLTIQLVIHPVVAVIRDDQGRLQRILPAAQNGSAGGPAEPGQTGDQGRDQDVILESWMHLEVDWQPEGAAHERLTRCIAEVVGDVRRAVRDWPAMVAQVHGVAAGLVAAPPRGVPAEQVRSTIELLTWLAADHFTFLGYRAYDLVGLDGPREDYALAVVPGSGLGLMRDSGGESVAFRDLPTAVRVRADEPRPLIITKTNRRSTVHRAVHLDYIGVKRFDRTGRVIGEHRFVGLLSASAYTESVETIPVISAKVRALCEELGYTRASHGGRDLMQFLETFPRDELFAIETEDLTRMAQSWLSLQERRTTKVFVRHDTYERFMSAFVVVPRDRYTTDIRLRIQEVLCEAVGGESVDYTARVTESVLARLYVVVRMPRGVPVPQVDEAALEAQVAEVVRTWEDRVTQRLVTETSEADAHRILRRYPHGFPEVYRAATTTDEAVIDLAELTALSPRQPLRVLLQPVSRDSGEQANARLELYSLDDIALADVLPVLGSLGVELVTEQPFRFEGTDAEGDPRGEFLFDLGLSCQVPGQLREVRELWEEGFLAVWRGLAEPDGFNALITRAGLDWRQVAILRCYARYLRQVGSTFSQELVEATLLGQPALAEALVRLFAIRFDPDHEGDRESGARVVVEEIVAGLAGVASLDRDRILRSLLDLVMATVRTNHYRAGREALAVKLDPTLLAELPEPRPAHEIWVQAPRVEGVHLRFGRIARGGLRWSDRAEDFRTEVLGLVKAQEAKNAVIVPDGAKGGFFAKQLPDPTADRDAWLAEGQAAYRVYVGALLDLTDNLVAGQVVPPERVVRHDGDDPYLVVAADKGTAAFSDLANSVAHAHGYWLGDAFASGGSAGFDHKEMGITARGAWESAVAHLRERAVDAARDHYTVVGIGDMSGDVFGNGMLRSESMLLVAAFDHRHVFLDPHPDPAASFAERRRLYALPRSSWADYDPALISSGGGVYPRTAKAVPISAEVAEVLAMSDPPATMTPTQVIRAILTAQVELLYNGGIGTYVKASSESDAEVGDRANDAVRVDGADLRAAVVVEGGNLGLTQRGRIEAARHGVRLNTDAIDNSAGVDTSDHEVNLKILLGEAVRAGVLDHEERNELLRSMTGDVAAAVLAHNVAQNLLLGFEEHLGAALLPAHRRLISALEASTGLNRALQALPPDAALAPGAEGGRSLTRPELAVLVAYSKLDAKSQLLASAVPDEPFAQPWLTRYFPGLLGQRFAEQAAQHPLRRQILTASMVNQLVDRGGISYVQRACEETGAAAGDVARAFAVTVGVFGLEELWERIDAREGAVPEPALYALRAEAQRLLDRSTRWLLQTRGGALDVPGLVQRFGPTVHDLAGQVPDWLIGVERQRLDHRITELAVLGAPAGLAAQVAALLDVYPMLDIVEVARRTDRDPALVARTYFTISERFEIDRFLTRITALPRTDRWSTLARSALRSDLYSAVAGLTAKVVRAMDPDSDPREGVRAWEQRHAAGLSRSRATLTEVIDGDQPGLATLSVALRTFRTLAQQGD